MIVRMLISRLKYGTLKSNSIFNDEGCTMTIEEADRVTPIGLFHYANSYACSAFALAHCNVDCLFQDPPARFLYTHAIELYLKSYLRLNGITIDKLRSRKLGHKISALRTEAQNFGLRLNSCWEKQLDLLDNAIRDRYIETGFITVLYLPTLHDLCTYLNTQIGSQIYESCNLTKTVPSIPTWEVKPN